MSTVKSFQFNILVPSLIKERKHKVIDLADATIGGPGVV